MARELKSAPAGERLAVLEQQMAHVTAQLTANSAVLGEIKQQMARQKGFIGGIIFLVSAVWAAAGVALAYFRP